MAGRQHCKLYAMRGKECIADDEQRAGTLSDERRENRFDLAFTEAGKDCFAPTRIGHPVKSRLSI
jgi:hypothetical protein